MKKLKFLFKSADKKTRGLGIAALVLAFIAIISLVVSANVAVNSAITDLPIIKLVVGESNIDSFNKEYDDLIDEIEEAIDNNDNAKIEELEDELGVPVEEVLELLDPISLKSVKTLSSMIPEIGDEMELVFSAIITGINGYAFILGLFVALSALFMNKGWFITAAVLSPVFFFVFVGAVWFFVFLALCIAYCILSSKVRDAYIIHNAAIAAAAKVAPAAEAEVEVETENV